MHTWAPLLQLETRLTFGGAEPPGGTLRGGGLSPGLPCPYGSQMGPRLVGPQTWGGGGWGSGMGWELGGRAL